MAARTLAGSLGLTGDWDLGEDNWKDANDLNLLVLSVVGQGTALELVSATPGAPVEGAVYLFSDTHPTNPGDIAVYDEAEWKYFTPAIGWTMWDTASAFRRQFDGSTWIEVTSGGGGVEEAPIDGSPYARQDAGWVAAGGGGGGGVAPVQTEAGNYTLAPGDSGHYIRLTGAAAKTVDIALDATTALPANGEWNIRNVGAGAATVTPVVGVTVNAPSGGTLVMSTGMTATLKRAAANTFDLIGQTVAA